MESRLPSLARVFFCDMIVLGGQVFGKVLMESCNLFGPPWVKLPATNPRKLRTAGRKEDAKMTSAKKANA